MPWPGRAPGERYLLTSEQRVISVRRHAALLARPFAELAAALLVAGWVTAQVPAANLFVDLLWWGVLAVLARTLWQVLEWANDRLIVTDRRILLVSGLLTRRVAMMPLRKVTDMTYERPLLGRLLGYGEFVLESAGQDQALHRIGYLPSPDGLYREISQLLFGPDGVPPDLDDGDLPLSPAGRRPPAYDPDLTQPIPVVSPKTVPREDPPGPARR